MSFLMDVYYCPACGYERPIGDKARYCPKCQERKHRLELLLRFVKIVKKAEK